MDGPMADLEHDALKRDHRFLVRLVVVMILGTFAGLFIYAGITGERVAGCATEAVGGVSQTPSSE